MVYNIITADIKKQYGQCCEWMVYQYLRRSRNVSVMYQPQQAL